MRFFILSKQGFYMNYFGDTTPLRRHQIYAYSCHHRAKMRGRWSNCELVSDAYILLPKLFCLLCPRSSKSGEWHIGFSLSFVVRRCPFTFFSSNHSHYCFILLVGKCTNIVSENFAIFCPFLRFLSPKIQNFSKNSKSN